MAFPSSDTRQPLNPIFLTINLFDSPFHSTSPPLRALCGWGIGRTQIEQRYFRISQHFVPLELAAVRQAFAQMCALVELTWPSMGPSSRNGGPE